MRTFVRVTQFGLLAFVIHFGGYTIFGQQKPKTEFFKRDQVDAFDEVNEKLMKISEDNCGIKVRRDWYHLCDHLKRKGLKDIVL